MLVQRPPAEIALEYEAPQPHGFGLYRISDAQQVRTLLVLLSKPQRNGAPGAADKVNDIFVRFSGDTGFYLVQTFGRAELDLGPDVAAYMNKLTARAPDMPDMPTELKLGTWGGKWGGTQR